MSVTIRINAHLSFLDGSGRCGIGVDGRYAELLAADVRALINLLEPHADMIGISFAEKLKRGEMVNPKDVTEGKRILRSLGFTWIREDWDWRPPTTHDDSRTLLPITNEHCVVILAAHVQDDARWTLSFGDRRMAEAVGPCAMLDPYLATPGTFVIFDGDALVVLVGTRPTGAPPTDEFRGFPGLR